MHDGLPHQTDSPLTPPAPGQALVYCRKGLPSGGLSDGPYF